MYKRKKGFSYMITLKRLFILIVVLIFCLKIGVITGNYIYFNQDKFFSKFKVTFFDKILFNSFPLIDVSINESSKDFSISNSLLSIMSTALSFDAKRQITLLNAQSPLLLSFPLLTKHNLLEVKKDKLTNNDNNIIKNYNLKENASSIFFEENSYEPYTENNSISYENIRITNETNYKIDISKILQESLNLNFKKMGPKVLIYHTHSNEAYLDNIAELNNKNHSVRSNDTKKNILKIGQELKTNLEKSPNIEVIHDVTKHNEYSDIGAYEKSLITATNIINKQDSINLIFDIHRDGLSNNKKLRVVNESKNTKTMSKIMFVVGTNYRGLEHPYWKKNLKFAILLQEKLNSVCKGITRPIYISKNRYNQHLKPGSLIIEVGGDGNLLSESIESTKYISKAINEIIKEYQ